MMMKTRIIGIVALLISLVFACFFGSHRCPAEGRPLVLPGLPEKPLSNAPALTVITPAGDTVTNRELCTVTGFTAAGNKVSVNGAPAVVDSVGNFSRVVKLNLGQNKLVITSTGPGGQKTSTVRNIIYDNVPPVLTVISPAAGAETGNNIAIVTGYTEPACLVKVNGMPANVDSAGNFSKVVDLAVYSNELTVVATDKAGNSTTVNRTVVFNDNRIAGFKLPEIIKLGVNASLRYNLTLDGYVTVKIFNADGECIKTLADAERKTARAYAHSWDGTDANGSPVPDGTYRFVVEARDEQGNIIGRAEQSRMAARRPVFNEAGANPEVFDPSAGQTCAIDYAISADALVTVTVYKGNVPVKVVTADAYKPAGSHRTLWDGTGEKGEIVPDALYNYKIDIASPVVPALKSTFKGTVSVEKEAPSITGLKYSPKPFRIKRSNLCIVYRLSEKALVTLRILDKSGQVLFTGLAAEERNAGTNSFWWDGRLSNGQFINPGKYIVRMCAADSHGKLSRVSTLDFEAVAAAPGAGKGLYLNSASYRTLRDEPWAAPGPEVVSTTPPAGTGTCPVDVGIEVVFNKSIRAGDGFNGIALTVEGRKVACTATIRGKRLIIKPSEQMAFSTEYNVTVPAGAVQDFPGTPLKAPFSFSFVTEAAPRPPGTGVVSLAEAAVSYVTGPGNKTSAAVTLDEKVAAGIIAKAGEIKTALIPVTVSANCVNVQLTGGLLKTLEARNAVIEVRTPQAAVVFPATAVDLQNLARQLQADAAEITLGIEISAGSHAATTALAGTAREKGLAVAAGPVDFKVTARYGGRTAGVVWNRYVKYVLFLPEGEKTELIAGIQTAATGGLTPMPTGSRKENGIAGAVISSRETGTFAIVRSAGTFRDIKNHWASQDIALMSARLVVSGVGNKTFHPDKPVTRAQFVTMLVRGLGLAPDESSPGFHDVRVNAWYSGYVQEAAGVGLISGYADGTFRPEAPIKREEAAAVMLRALEWLGSRSTALPGEPEKWLARFRDRTRVSPWAQTGVAGAVGNGLVTGYTDGTFAPHRFITRAESAVMVRKLLAKGALM